MLSCNRLVSRLVICSTLFGRSAMRTYWELTRD